MSSEIGDLEGVKQKPFGYFVEGGADFFRSNRARRFVSALETE
jgi:hypothetical protein